MALASQNVSSRFGPELICILFAPLDMSPLTNVHFSSKNVLQCKICLVPAVFFLTVYFRKGQGRPNFCSSNGLEPKIGFPFNLGFDRISIYVVLNWAGDLIPTLIPRPLTETFLPFFPLGFERRISDGQLWMLRGPGRVHAGHQGHLSTVRRRFIHFWALSRLSLFRL